jgi:hypothetical protein
MKLDVVKFVHRLPSGLLSTVSVAYFLDGLPINKDLAEKHVREAELRLVSLEVGGDRPARTHDQP